MLLIELIWCLGRVEERKERVIIVEKLAEELAFFVLGEPKVVELAGDAGHGVGASAFKMEKG